MSEPLISSDAMALGLFATIGGARAYTRSVRPAMAPPSLCFLPLPVMRSALMARFHTQN
jgi:hypothetical protein